MLTREELNRTPNIAEPSVEKMLSYWNGERMPSFDIGWKAVEFGLLAGNVVGVSGYGNHGKGTFVRQMALQMNKLHGTKWAFWAPEDMPEEYFYSDIIHTYTGKSTESKHSNFIPKDEYLAAYKHIKSFVNLCDFGDETPTPEALFGQFDRMKSDYGCSGFVIDPFNNVDVDFDAGRDDNIIRKIALASRAWARKNNAFLIIVMHPRSPSGIKSGADTPMPKASELHHGSEWAKVLDDIIFYHHPTFDTDRSNNARQLCFAKVKKAKISGQAGIRGVQWKFEENRIYDFGGECGLDVIKTETFEQKQLKANTKFSEQTKPIETEKPKESLSIIEELPF